MERTKKTASTEAVGCTINGRWESKAGIPLGGQVMWRAMLSCLLILTLVVLGRPVVAVGQSSDPASAVKKQLTSIPTGKKIEVKLKQEGSKKITGKLGSVTEEGFEVQTVKSGKVSSERVAFADVKSVKKTGRMGTTLVVAGLIVVVVLVLYEYRFQIFVRD
jgi:hypothetical protein